MVLLILVYFFTTHKANSSDGNGDGDSASYQKGLEYSRANNYPMALENFQISANSGHSGAMFEMAKIFLKGNEEISIDINEAIKWFTEADKAGNKDAMFQLGNFYHYSDNTTKDNTKAFNCYSKASELGNKDAMLQLSEMYYNAEGVAKNKGLGDYWRGKASE